MKKILNLIVPILLLIACQKPEKKTDTTSPVLIDLVASIKNAKPTKKFKDIFEIVDIIKLESKESSFIATLDKLIFIDNKIVVLDKKYVSTKVFDRNGGFIRDIIKIGQGPGEFTKVFDMDYSQTDNSIFIYSNDDMKLGNFNLDGGLISETRIPYYAYYFTRLNKDSTLFFINYNSSEYNDKNNLLLTDANFKVLNKYFPYKRNYAVSFSGSLIKSNGGLFYNDAYEGDVYQFKNNQFILVNKVSLGKYQIPLESTQDFFSPIKSALDYAHFGKISAKLNDCFIFNFLYDRRYNIGIYFDKTKQTYINGDFEKNDIYHIISPPKAKEDDASMFYATISPRTLGYLINKPNFFEDLQKNYPKLFPYLKDLKDTDNPIILLFRKK